MKFTIFRLLFLQMQYTKIEYTTVAFEIKLLMNDERQCDGRLTMTDADCWQ